MDEVREGLEQGWLVDRPPFYGEAVMPQWLPEEATSFQLYEMTTEGTPLSPVFASLDELAAWAVEQWPDDPHHSTAAEWLEFFRFNVAEPWAVQVDWVRACRERDWCLVKMSGRARRLGGAGAPIAALTWSVAGVMAPAAVSGDATLLGGTGGSPKLCVRARVAEKRVVTFGRECLDCHGGGIVFDSVEGPFEQTPPQAVFRYPLTSMGGGPLVRVRLCHCIVRGLRALEQRSAETLEGAAP